jgi:hypothetical protein
MLDYELSIVTFEPPNHAFNHQWNSVDKASLIKYIVNQEKLKALK